MTEAQQDRDKRKDSEADRAADEQKKRKHESDLLDEALKETFPASDPVSIAQAPSPRKTGA